MTFILALLAKLIARPAVLVGVIGSLALGGMALALKIEKGRHAKDVANLQQTIASKDILIANQALSISSERHNVTKLQAAVDARNHTIEEQALRLTAIQREASAIASQSFKEGMASVKALAAPSSPLKSDAPNMNKWVIETFGGAP